MQNEYRANERTCDRSHRSKKQGGFSIIEVMIAVGMLGILSLGTASVVDWVNKSLSSSKTKSDIIEIGEDVRGAVHGTVTCAQNMIVNAVNVPNQLNLTQVKYYDTSGTAVSTIVPSLNTALPGISNLQISSMKLIAPGGGSSSTPALLSTTASNKFYAADMMVTYNQTSGYGIQYKPAIVKGLQLKTDLTGDLVSCQIGTESVCVTGEYNGSTGTGTIAYADTGFSGTYSTVFTEITGANFGLKCNPGWNMTGCTGTSLISPSTTIDGSLRITGAGCYAPSSSANATSNSRVYLTCCASP